ncbi:MAG: DNA polymerase I, partial [Ignavibacteriae bacterium]|nr:DNA polymerase I [Ignavibacteriota bacterium]
VENLYEHVSEIPQKGLREKLTNNKELAFLSKKLVTIHIDVPVEIDFHTLRAAKRNTSGLIRIFGELEFRSLASKLRDTEEFVEEVSPSRDTTRPHPSDISSDEHSYHCITSLHALDELCVMLSEAGQIAMDTETTSADALRAELVGLAFACTEREAYYVPVRNDNKDSIDDGTLFGSALHTDAAPNNTSDALPLAAVLGKMKPILENPSIRKIGQDIKYDILVLKAHGIHVEGIAFDTMVASYIIRADGQHSLDALAKEYLGYTMMTFEELVGKGRNQKHITEVPLDALANYSAQDADMMLRVYQRQLTKLQELEMLGLCNEVEFPLIPVLARMEFAGISLNVEYLSRMSKDLDRQINDLVREIYRAAGEEFNINSTQQLADILFKKLNLPTVRKTKTGFSTDVNVLETLKGLHPIIDKLLDYRQFTKLKSTYIDALPQLINPQTGRVHTSFNQTVAATGRLSGSDPNLQNIPIRTEIGRAIRKAFTARGQDSVLMSADYSQIELRVMAHISGDEGLVEAFRNNEDIHASTAAKVFGVDPADLTRDMRRKAKEVNFGIMYGIGPFGLATRLEITQSESREIIAKYFERFPKVKQYINDTIDSARRHGYVSTQLGRRRYLPDINSRNRNIRSNAERQAINMPIQGTAADMIKVAMINIDKEIVGKKMKSTMLLQVHDELVFEVHASEVSAMKEIVLDRMRSSLRLNVPIVVDIGTGNNWLEAH